MAQTLKQQHNNNSRSSSSRSTHTHARTLNRWKAVILSVQWVVRQQIECVYVCALRVCLHVRCQCIGVENCPNCFCSFSYAHTWIFHRRRYIYACLHRIHIYMDPLCASHPNMHTHTHMQTIECTCRRTWVSDSIRIGCFNDSRKPLIPYSAICSSRLPCCAAGTSAAYFQNTCVSTAKRIIYYLRKGWGDPIRTCTNKMFMFRLKVLHSVRIRWWLTAAVPFGSECLCWPPLPST